MKNAINWFEIPTNDIDRAQLFYERIFGITFGKIDLPNIKMRMFPIEDPSSGIGEALVNTDGFHKPSSSKGPLVYLNANPDVQLALDKVEAAREKVFVPKTTISKEFGFIGVIIDTEGNRIALHSVS